MNRDKLHFKLFLDGIQFYSFCQMIEWLSVYHDSVSQIFLYLMKAFPFWWFPASSWWFYLFWATLFFWWGDGLLCDISILIECEAATWIAILCVREVDAPLNAKELDWVFVESIADRFLYSTFPFITNNLFSIWNTEQTS